MDEFHSEKEQIEIFRQWWRENGWYLVGGIGIGVFGLLGWNRYNAHVDTRAEEAAAIYVELREAVGDDDMGGARNLLNELRDDFPSSPYTDQGGLLVALIRLDAGQVDGAIDELRFVMESTGDPELALIARLRLARVLVQDEAFEEALTVLDVAPGSFSARYNEVRGDIHAALGDADSARAAYNAALNAQEADFVDKNLVQLKLDDLPAVATPPVRFAPQTEPGPESPDGEPVQASTDGGPALESADAGPARETPDGGSIPPPAEVDATPAETAE